MLIECLLFTNDESIVDNGNTSLDESRPNWLTCLVFIRRRGKLGSKGFKPCNRTWVNGGVCGSTGTVGTIINLLSKFYEFQKGKITMTKFDIRDIP